MRAGSTPQSTNLPCMKWVLVVIRRRVTGKGALKPGDDFTLVGAVEAPGGGFVIITIQPELAAAELVGDPAGDAVHRVGLADMHDIRPDPNGSQGQAPGGEGGVEEQGGCGEIALGAAALAHVHLADVDDADAVNLPGFLGERGKIRVEGEDCHLVPEEDELAGERKIAPQAAGTVDALGEQEGDLHAHALSLAAADQRRVSSRCTRRSQSACASSGGAWIAGSIGEERLDGLRQGSRVAGGHNPA